MLPRRYLISICSAIVGAVLMWLMPGSSIDRAFFKLNAQLLTSEDCFVTGSGSHAEPYRLNTLGNLTDRTLPVLILVTDDPDEVFEAIPPSPVDYAIILRNLSRIGFGNIGFGNIAFGNELAWDEADVISVSALEQNLNKWESAILSTALTRGPISNPIPDALRRGSINKADAIGDTSLFPKVNQLALYSTLLGSEKSIAGFTSLELKGAQSNTQLIAQWDDRLIFSLPLLVTARIFGVSPEEIEVTPGQHICLGRNGPVIEIDDYGRLKIPVEHQLTEGLLSYTAESIFDLPDSHFAQASQPFAVILDDPRTSLDQTTTYTENFTSAIHSLWQTSTKEVYKSYQRPQLIAEILFLTAIIFLVLGLSFLEKFSGKLTLYCVLFLIFDLHIVAFVFGEIWLPSIAAIAMVAIAIPLTANDWIKRPHLRGNLQLYLPHQNQRKIKMLGKNSLRKSRAIGKKPKIESSTEPAEKDLMENRSSTTTPSNTSKS